LKGRMKRVKFLRRISVIIYSLTQNEKPGLVGFYDIRPGNATL